MAQGPIDFGDDPNQCPDPGFLYQGHDRDSYIQPTW